MASSEALAGNIATFSEVKGEVRILSRVRAEGRWLRVTKTGVGLYNGDRIRTIDGKATVTFPDGSVIKVSENSDITIEERPTRRKLFGFVDISFINRNVKVAFGKLWANVKHARGKWTSFDTRSAVAGIKGTTITLEVDSFGNMNFTCDEGFVEISRPDGAVGLQLDSGKQVWIKAIGNERTLIQSVHGDIDIEADGIKINMENKGAVVIGPNEGTDENDTFIEAAEDSEGVVTVTTGVVEAALDPGEAVIITKDEDYPDEVTIVAAADNTSPVDLTIGDVTAVLDADEGVHVETDAGLGISTITVVQGEVEMTKDGVTKTYSPGEEEYANTPGDEPPPPTPIVNPPPWERKKPSFFDDDKPCEITNTCPPPPVEETPVVVTPCASPPC